MFSCSASYAALSGLLAGVFASADVSCGTGVDVPFVEAGAKVFSFALPLAAPVFALGAGILVGWVARAGELEGWEAGNEDGGGRQARNYATCTLYGDMFLG